MIHSGLSVSSSFVSSLNFLMFSTSRVGRTKSFYRDFGDHRELNDNSLGEDNKKLKKFFRVKKMSTMDLRQALAGLLTFSMFIMLGNMVKKDHFDSYDDVDISSTQVSNVNVTAQSLATVSHLSKRPWIMENGEGLKPCWNIPILKEAEQSEGFITFTLTNGPEYHMSQIADAVVVARYLGATLVLPDIKGSKPGNIMSFGDIYEVEEFLNSLDGVVRVTRTRPIHVENPPIVRVPSKVTEDYIVKRVQPIYKAKGIVKIESHFPSVDATIALNKNNKLNSLACQAMFGTLKLKPEIEQVIESMLQNLHTRSQNNGQFIAVDLRSDEVLEKKECHKRYESGRKLCYQAQEIGEFLKKVGFSQDTVIYVTQSKWNPDLDALKVILPNTYIKESVMPEAMKTKFLSSEFENVIDFHISSLIDVFVPATPSLFYENVAGIRIASGRKQILLPNEITSPSASASDYMSPYMSQKNHFAYSCFC